MPAARRILRIYADTSVFGGCFDAEFAQVSRQLFDGIHAGLYRLVLSDVVLRELERSPEPVRQLLLQVPDLHTERADLSLESMALRDEYIKADVLGPRWIDDAAHVAIATLARADAIVSWNFRHLVRLDHIRQFNAVNLRLGYPLIEIRSPREIVYESQDD